MQASPVPVPASLPADANDVAEALRLAAAFWAKGNHADAIRWVRRAAEAANEAGDAARMAVLARSASDLEQVARSVPPASTRMPTSRPPPLPARAIRSVPPPAPAARPPSARPPSSVPPASARPPSARPASVRPPSQPQPQSRPPPHSRPPSESQSQTQPMPQPNPNEIRVRVSVKTSVRDPQLLVVRRLADGEPPRPGTVEAWLVIKREDKS